jgi:hypothetical protein
MKICDVKAYAVKIPRSFKAALRTAGLPAPLTELESTENSEQPSLKWAEVNQTIYSTRIETTFVRVETDTGIVGWGESQSPVAPEITRTIIETLLRPIVIGEVQLHQKYCSNGCISRCACAGTLEAFS